MEISDESSIYMDSSYGMISYQDIINDKTMINSFGSKIHFMDVKDNVFTHNGYGPIRYDVHKTILLSDLGKFVANWSGTYYSSPVRGVFKQRWKLQKNSSGVEFYRSDSGVKSDKLPENSNPISGTASEEDYRVILLCMKYITKYKDQEKPKMHMYLDLYIKIKKIDIVRLFNYAMLNIYPRTMTTYRSRIHMQRDDYNKYSYDLESTLFNVLENFLTQIDMNKIDELLGTQEIKESIDNKINKEIEKDVDMKLSKEAFSINKPLPEQYSNFLLKKDKLVAEMKEEELKRQQNLTNEASVYMKTRLDEHNIEINKNINNILGRCFRTWYIIGTSKLVADKIRENNRFKLEWNYITTNFGKSTASHAVFPGTLILDFVPIGQFLQLTGRTGTTRTNAEAEKTQAEKDFNNNYNIYFKKIESNQGPYMTMENYVKKPPLPQSGSSRKSRKSRKYRKSHTRRNR